MAPKRNAAGAASGSSSTAGVAPAAVPGTVVSQSKTAQPKGSKGGNPQSASQVFQVVYDRYVNDTPLRTKLIDVFLFFLVIVGGVQALYCLVASRDPFNAFLSGFGVTVAQFVLTASLRIQTNEANKSDFPSVSPERAFTDYLVCSFIVHFFAINYIN